MVECLSDQDQSRAKWTTFSTKIFADLLVEQIRNGNRGSGAFSKLAWKIIRDEFNNQTGLKFDKQQLKNHLDVLRKRYNSVKAILGHTGFSWDVGQYMVLAEDDVWQQYIEVEFLDHCAFNVYFIDSIRLLSWIIYTYRHILRQTLSEKGAVIYMNSFALYSHQIPESMRNMPFPFQEQPCIR